MTPEETASTEKAEQANEAPRPPDQGVLTSKDGTRIWFRHFLPKTKTRARAQVLVVHGFAEHSGRYLHVLAGLAARGIEAWALDLRGHGKSTGGRGCIASFDDYSDDLEALVTESNRAIDAPRFLLGHSMGGLVSTRFLQERDRHGVRGLLLSSPFYRVKMPVPAVKRGAARMLSGLWPSLKLATGLDASGLSRDPEVVRAYVSDPLVFTTATPRWFTETTRAQALALEKAPALTLPALVIHGALDPLADPEATHEVFAKLGSQDKTLKLWEGLRHEILNEPEKNDVLAMMVDWVEKRSPQ